MISDERGCMAKDQFTISVSLPDIFIPNIFSPNHDGVNDRFVLSGSELVDQVNFIRIYNRWGIQVYEGTALDINDDEIGWDGTFRGKEAAQGVYAYFIEVQLYGGKKETYRGSVTLLR